MLDQAETGVDLRLRKPLARLNLKFGPIGAPFNFYVGVIFDDLVRAAD